MRKTREILRQKHLLSRSHREIAKSAGVSAGVVSLALARARAAGLSWEQVEALSDHELEARLYPAVAQACQRAEPDCSWVHRERHRPGVTLELLHHEYLEQHPGGLGYTAFCDRYRGRLRRRGLFMRQVHEAGDKLFVDYSGKKPRIVGMETGEVTEVELFVAARTAALLRVVGALLAGGKLSLTHLGRSFDGAGHAKHHIKAVDRLLGNRHLHRERDGIYRAIVQTLLLGNKRPVIVIDWSDFELGREWLMLKAAVPVGGRAISLYERVFPFKRYNSPGAHREFLRALRAVLPEDCRPIIITDAGFRGPWFRDVEAYGWDWIGRIRNKIQYYREETGRWRFTDSLYPEATGVPRHIGEVTLSKRHNYRFRLYSLRGTTVRLELVEVLLEPPDAAQSREASCVPERRFAERH